MSLDHGLEAYEDFMTTYDILKYNIGVTKPIVITNKTTEEIPWLTQYPLVYFSHYQDPRR